LGEICKLQWWFAFKSEEFKKSWIPIIRISNISNNNNYIDLSNIIYYDEIKNDENYIIKNWDLIIAMSWATTWKSSIYNLKEKAYLNQRVWLFKANLNKLNYWFLIQFIFSDLFYKQLDWVLVAGAQPNISWKDIENFILNLPNLKEQEKIADFLSGIDEKIEKVSDELGKMEEFKKGLLQGMFV
jgi:type I restriction enzyme S subunit